MEFLYTGGPFMFILLLLLAVILILSIKMIIVLFVKKSRDHLSYEHTINSILFWGILSLLLGFLGKYAGLYKAMSTIILADDVSPGLLIAGYQQSLVSALAGLVIAILSFLFWFILKSRLKKLNSVR
ncbi:MAG: MotA/TolQ/ExbB proton channel family protein [bacterium]|nr:MotA/TolQ/ExbB proton channel family protein [bacterium]